MKYQNSSINLTFTNEELTLLLKKSLLGDQQARHRIYVSFLPRVDKTINLFPEKTKQELLELGRLALIKAIDTFKCESNLNFNYTFRYYLNQSIISFLKFNYDEPTINTLKFASTIKNIEIYLNEYNYENDIEISKKIKRSIRKLDYLNLKSKFNISKFKQKRF